MSAITITFQREIPKNAIKIVEFLRFILVNHRPNLIGAREGKLGTQSGWLILSIGCGGRKRRNEAEADLGGIASDPRRGEFVQGWERVTMWARGEILWGGWWDECGIERWGGRKKAKWWTSRRRVVDGVCGCERETVLSTGRVWRGRLFLRGILSGIREEWKRTNVDGCGRKWMGVDESWHYLGGGCWLEQACGGRPWALRTGRKWGNAYRQAIMKNLASI
jgi:hypothetical protein